MCFSFLHLFFAKKCILRWINFFLLPNHGGQNFTDFFQTLCNLVMLQWCTCNFLEMKRLKNLQTSVSTIIRFSQNLWQNVSVNKSNIHKGICKPDNLFKPTATDTLTFKGWKSKSTYVAKRGCPFWIYWTLLLNSKIGWLLGFI